MSEKIGHGMSFSRDGFIFSLKKEFIYSLGKDAELMGELETKESSDA